MKQKNVMGSLVEVKEYLLPVLPCQYILEMVALCSHAADVQAEFVRIQTCFGNPRLPD